MTSQVARPLARQTQSSVSAGWWLRLWASSGVQLSSALNQVCVVAQTVISTPTKNYTVLEQKQLLLDMGDSAGVSQGEPTHL